LAVFDPSPLLQTVAKRFFALRFDIPDAPIPEAPGVYLLYIYICI
jgi:hypothetical protein